MSMQKEREAFQKRLAAQKPVPKPIIQRAATPTAVTAAVIDLDKEPPKKKQKPNTQTGVVWSQPQDTSMGSHLLTQVQYAIDWLKAFPSGRTTNELEGYLSVKITPSLARILQNSPRLLYDSTTRTYAFRPVFNIRSKAQLVTYLGNQKIAQGLPIKDLKEAWPMCLQEVEELEEAGSVLLLRNKKDNSPKTVWASSSEWTLPKAIDEEFKQIWENTKVPPPGDLPKALTDVGLKPTSLDPTTVTKKRNEGEGGKQKKPKNRRIKVTNTHMGSLKSLGLRN